MTNNTRYSSTRGIAAGLDRDWGALRRSAGAIAQARRWAEHVDDTVAHLVGGVTDLEQIVGATHASAGDAGELLLSELVALADNDQLAGRVLRTTRQVSKSK